MPQYSIGDVIDVRVEKIVPRGLGLAFAEKLTIFVPLSAPGDELRVEIRHLKKRIAFAEIVEIKKAGPERAVPPCPYFATCGGCDLQQINYTAQLAAKVGIIRDCLARIGKIELDRDITVVPSPDPLQYRSRARWHLDRDRAAIGYFARESHDVVDVDVCPILTPDLQTVLTTTREEIDWETMWDDRGEIEAAADDDGHTSKASQSLAEPTSEIVFTSDGHTYRYSAEVFFQANRLLVAELIGVATGGAEGATAFDLYSGVGLFTLPLAGQFEKVVAVEENPAAVGFAKQNVENAGFDNVRLVGSSVTRFLTENQKKRVEFVLIDPPRSGTEKHTIDQLARLKPARISYVSCEPSILARDLRALIDAGYVIENITALDLFPQTHHVETVVRLVAV